jgi:hypothetical protein
LTAPAFPWPSGKNNERLACTASPGSNVDLFNPFPIEVPARTVAEVWEKGVDAALVLRLVEIELGFTVLLRHRVITLDCHSSEWTAVLRHPVPD